MEVWVAGATGVLGRHTVPLLLAAGHKVVGLARDKAKWPDAPSEMEFLPCDITVSGQVLQAFAGRKPDAVIHMATAMPGDRPNRAAWARNDEVRRAGTHNLVDAALVIDAYYVQLSTHYVTAANGEAWIDENSPFAHTSITDSAIDAERVVQKSVNSGLRACILRASSLYSIDSPQTRAIVNAVKTGTPILLGHGTNYWSFVHPYDVATAIIKVLERQPPGEPYCISDDEPIRMLDCLQWIAQELHTKPPRSVAPFLAKMALGGDTVDLLMGSRRISNAKAKRDLEWKPRFASFREGFDILFVKPKPV